MDRFRDRRRHLRRPALLVLRVATDGRPTTEQATRSRVWTDLVTGLHAAVRSRALVAVMVAAAVALTTLLQEATPDELRGRIGSVFSTVVTTASVTSMALAGAAAALLGIRGVFVLAGAIAVLSGLLAAVLFHSRSAVPLPSVHSSE